MATYIGRQPILNVAQQTIGYELLFRSGIDNVFTGAVDGDKASASVINASFFELGIQQLTGGKKAFINCTRALLLGDYLDMLPKDKVVLEVLETVEPDAQLVAACRRLRNAGYTLALDDFKYCPAYDELILLADIIKVDLHQSDLIERRQVAEKFLPLGIKLLAERVETFEELAEVKEFGYSLFQGYYFSRPVMVETKRSAAGRLPKLALLHEVNSAAFSIEDAENIIKHDPVLTLKMLKYINSVAFGVRQEVHSIRQALVLLGQRNIRKWINLLLLNSLGDEKPEELMRQTVLRGRFCELLAAPAGHPDEEQDLFLLGVFSLLDALADQPLGYLLNEFPLPELIKEALLGEAGLYLDILLLVKAFESGDWNEVFSLTAKCHLDEDRLPVIYQDAITWTDQMVEQ